MKTWTIMDDRLRRTSRRLAAGRWRYTARRNRRNLPEFVEDAIDCLVLAGVTLSRGLGDEEFERIQTTFGFQFGSEHRALLAAVLPVGGGFHDWRNEPADDLQRALDWPVQGVVFDVLNNGFWPSSWGERPTESAVAEQIARRRLALVPTLVPIYGHRYLPAEPAPVPSPVFSVHQTDVIYYGANLSDYLARELRLPSTEATVRGPLPRVAFWSDLADQIEDVDL